MTTRADLSALRDPPSPEESMSVVMLDDPHYGAGPGVVVEVTAEPVRGVLARYADRDGARSDRLRLWRSFPGCCVGDRVALGTVRA